jgi:hypothetical protein
MLSDSNNGDSKKSAAEATGKDDPRRARLARALRDNLKKRKAQQRERRAGAAPAAPGGDDSRGDDSPGGGA